MDVSFLQLTGTINLSLVCSMNLLYCARICVCGVIISTYVIIEEDEIQATHPLYCESRPDPGQMYFDSPTCLITCQRSNTIETRTLHCADK